jgi:hypothetical protein
MVRDADKAPTLSSRVLNLQGAPDDDNGVAYHIAKEVPDGTYGVVLQDFVKEGLIVTAPLTPFGTE